MVRTRPLANEKDELRRRVQSRIRRKLRWQSGAVPNGQSVRQLRRAIDAGFVHPACVAK